LRKSNSVGTRGETRSSGLWGTGRGGRGSDGRNAIVKRGLLAFLALALAAPLAAAADNSGSSGGDSASGPSYLAPSLQQASQQTPNAAVSVIVQSDSAPRAESMLDRYGADSSTRLDIVDAAAGQIRAGDLPKLAQRPGLVITPDQPVVLDARNDKASKNERAKWDKWNRRDNHVAPAQSFSSNELWPAAVGVDQLWPQLAAPSRRSTGRPDAPTIAFVDSGIEANRADFGDRVLAQVNLTSLPGNSAGDGRGHGTIVAGLAAGSAAHHAGAAPTAGIVSLDVMDDQGMARTSDVIAAAQWILHNRRQYDIRVANFSLHSATPSSFRWDPLDKAVEKLWFSGVVVVTASGNNGAANKSVRMGFAPANDPFVLTVGALDLHNSSSPDRADVAPWSAWGYTFDGFAKPELSAPGRSILGPVPAGSTLATERPKQVVHAPEGTYIRLSGTSLSAPIVAGIAADLLTLNPGLSPDQVKGALMLKARSLHQVRTLAAGVGEVYAQGAAGVSSPPNPNRGLNAFLVKDESDDGGLVFDDVSWLDAIKASPAWNSVSWLDGWANAAWSLVSWSDVSWSDVSWDDVSWDDVSWSDVSWDDVSWADLVGNDVYGDVG
jgi:serine protease AprX